MRASPPCFTLTRERRDATNYTNYSCCSPCPKTGCQLSGPIPSQGTRSSAACTGTRSSWAAGSHRHQLAQCPPHLLVPHLNQLAIFSVPYPASQDCYWVATLSAMGPHLRKGREQWGRGQGRTGSAEDRVQHPEVRLPNLAPAAPSQISPVLNHTGPAE